MNRNGEIAFRSWSVLGTAATVNWRCCKLGCHGNVVWRFFLCFLSIIHALSGTAWTCHSFYCHHIQLHQVNLDSSYDSGRLIVAFDKIYPTAPISPLEVTQPMKFKFSVPSLFIENYNHHHHRYHFVCLFLFLFLFLISGCIQLNHRTGMTFQMSEFAANGCVEAAVEWQSQPGHLLDLSWMIELFDWMCFTCYHLIFAWIPFFSFSFPFSGLKFPLDWTVFKLRRLEYFCTVAFWFMVERWCRRRLGFWVCQLLACLTG